MRMRRGLPTFSRNQLPATIAARNDGCEILTFPDTLTTQGLSLRICVVPGCSMAAHIRYGLSQSSPRTFLAHHRAAVSAAVGNRGRNNHSSHRTGGPAMSFKLTLGISPF